MRTLSVVLGALLAAVWTSAAERDVKITFDLLKKGPTLSAQEAEALEARLLKKPKDEDVRLELMAFYASRPRVLDLEVIKAARARHILWMVENDPKTQMGLRNVVTGIQQLHCSGDDLADVEAYGRVRDLWMQQLQRHPADTEIRSGAIHFIQYCDPEVAEKLLIEARDQSGLGRLYAIAALGGVDESYTSGELATVDPARRNSPLGQKAIQALENATDENFTVMAAITLLRQGGNLWADGKLDWDYSKVGSVLYAKAIAKDPQNFNLLTLTPELPKRGERPPMTLRVGGNVQSANLTRKITPAYPPEAKAARIGGTVRMSALIGLDGSVIGLAVVGGPRELVPTTVGAGRQWRYRPSLLNGKPCYVMTVIDVNYTMSRQ